MYLYGPTGDHQELGIIDPISAILTGSMLKDIFGIGAKKRAFKEMESTATGSYTSQFPPNVDWAEYINRPKYGIFRGEKMTIKASYDINRKRKDSEFLKKQIASAEDYGAYAVNDMIKKGYACDPNAKPGSHEYKTCPIYRDSKTNIFDKAARDAWAAKQQTTKPAPKPKSKPRKAPVLTKQPATLPPVSLQTNLQPQQGGGGSIADILRAITSQLPQNQFPPSAPVVAPAPAQETPPWLIPVAIGAGVLAVGFALNKRKRPARRRR